MLYLIRLIYAKFWVDSSIDFSKHHVGKDNKLYHNKSSPANSRTIRNKLMCDACITPQLETMEELYKLLKYALCFTRIDFGLARSILTASDKLLQMQNEPYFNNLYDEYVKELESVSFVANKLLHDITSREEHKKATLDTLSHCFKCMAGATQQLRKEIEKEALKASNENESV